jgi:BirA family biotin operon repressor/biotin-[acetyl-CoA-carboxylase] ligase
LVLTAEAHRPQLAALADAVEAGAPEDVATVALGGTFVGQRGRTWHAPPGNLQVAVRLRLGGPARALQGGLAALGSAAAAEAIEAVSGGRVAPGTKWVNDLVLGAPMRKAAGVLVAADVQGDALPAARIGIGVNVAVAPTLDAPDALPAIALADADAAFAAPRARADLAFAVLARLAVWRDVLVERGSAPLVDAYRARAAFLGRRVEVRPVAGGPPFAAGVAEALTPDLHLRIAGRAAPVATGRLRVVA